MNSESKASEIKSLGTNVTEDVFWRYKQYCASHSVTVTQRLREHVLNDLENDMFPDTTEDTVEAEIFEKELEATERQMNYIYHLENMIGVKHRKDGLTLHDADIYIKDLKEKAFSQGAK